MMKQFLDEDFLLFSDTAKELYHEWASNQPVIDFHCHLSPADIATDRNFKDLTEAWLEGDHYKWRAMRTHGIKEEYCTGEKAPFEKFKKWAEVVPYTLRNPLFHWTHLELKRYFGISHLLDPTTAGKIYDTVGEMLVSKDFSCRNLLRKMNVEVLCTSDDPIDSLEAHQQLQKEFEIKVLPTFRPDRALAVDNLKRYNEYIHQLEEITNMDISTFPLLLEALDNRHLFFHDMGCRLADHGIETFYSENYTIRELNGIFAKIREKKYLTTLEIVQFKSAILYEMGLMNASRGWAQQFHFGAIRNNNSRMMSAIGPDTGFDSIGDQPVAKNMSRFLDKLDSQGKLAKTIIYNLNPSDNELVTTMIGNFQDGSSPGKIQFGPGWWFMDQKEGMENHMNCLSSMGLLRHFIGMTTDSRSFLSYPRHEYFRRILCNMMGTDVETGLIPNEKSLLGNMVQDICYRNAKSYFGIGK